MTFSDGSFLEYAQGNYDEWCVYLTRPGQVRYPPRDEIYFAELLQYGNKHGAEQIYNDFVSIYNKTGMDLSDDVFKYIHEISEKFAEDSLEIEILYSILYMGMVAENNKKNAILKKRVKRLGVHQVLMDGMSPEEAANYSKRSRWLDNPQKKAIWYSMGKKFWKILDKECRARGF